MAKSAFLLSVIIPVFNEESGIEKLLERLIPILSAYKYEILFVDDGSKDKTAEKIKTAAKKNKSIKLIAFSRNFSHQMALTAGYLFAKGDCIVTIDADLQDPPEIIPAMIEKWQAGTKIVYAKRVKREKDTFFKKYTAWAFYKFVNLLSSTSIPMDVGDYRLLDREVVDFLNKLPEHSRFLRGLVAWGGFSEGYVEFERAERFAGETHYTFAKMLNFALVGITSFSTKPLRLTMYCGFAVAIIGFLGIIYAVIGKLFLSHYFEWISGWTLLFVGLMFFSGVQLVTIGIIGEYVGKIYTEVQNRPLYLVREMINMD